MWSSISRMSSDPTKIFLSFVTKYGPSLNLIVTLPFFMFKNLKKACLEKWSCKQSRDYALLWPVTTWPFYLGTTRNSLFVTINFQEKVRAIYSQQLALLTKFSVTFQAFCVILHRLSIHHYVRMCQHRQLRKDSVILRIIVLPFWREWLCIASTFRISSGVKVSRLP